MNVASGDKKLGLNKFNKREGPFFLACLEEAVDYPKMENARQTHRDLPTKRKLFKYQLATFPSIFAHEANGQKALIENRPELLMLLARRRFVCTVHGTESGVSCGCSAMVGGYTDMKPSHLAEELRNTEHVLSVIGNCTEKDAQIGLD